MYETPPVPDLARLRKTMDWVREQAARPKVESEWNQDDWVIRGESIGRTCGTAYCVAGYVVAQEPGMHLKWSGVQAYVVDEETGATTSVSYAAGKLLGLRHGERERLFSGANTLEDLERLAGEIAARGGERL